MVPFIWLSIKEMDSGLEILPFRADPSDIILWFPFCFQCWANQSCKRESFPFQCEDAGFRVGFSQQKHEPDPMRTSLDHAAGCASSSPNYSSETEHPLKIAKENLSCSIPNSGTKGKKGGKIVSIFHINTDLTAAARNVWVKQGLTMISAQMEILLKINTRMRSTELQ